jgi:dihydroflavonol-4-reductase
VGTADTPVDEQTPYQPRTPCPYAITKREAELVVLELVEDGLDAVIVNPTYMLGPWDWKPSSGKLLLSIARFRWWFAPRGVNDFTSVIDVAEAIVEAIEHGKRGERYILSGERRSYLSAFQTIAEACGKFRAFFSVGPSLMYPGAWIGDLTAFLTGREGECNSATIGLIRDRHFFSHEKATRELNYQPRELRAAAEEAWLWFREHGYARSYFGRPLEHEG